MQGSKLTGRFHVLMYNIYNGHLIYNSFALKNASWPIFFSMLNFFNFFSISEIYMIQYFINYNEFCKKKYDKIFFK